MSMTFTDSRFSSYDDTTVKVRCQKHDSGNATLTFDFDTDGGYNSANHAVKLCFRQENMSVIVATMIEGLINLQDDLPEIPLSEDEHAEA